MDNDPYLHTIFPSPPILAYRQPPNLKRILTSSKLTNTNTTYGTFPCDRTLCLLCPHINPTNTVTGLNGAQYHIKGSFNCNSANLIYAITSTLCPNSLYIGETGNNLRQRLNGHKSDIRKKKNTPVADHFNLPNHSLQDLQVCVLRRLSNDNRRQRIIAEQQLIRKFDTVQNGLNKDYAFMSHYIADY